MSSLLFDESPLVVSPVLAKAFGLNEAIVLQQIYYWQLKMDREVYNSYKDWKKQFPWWSTDTIRRAVISLQKKGVLEGRVDQQNGNKKYYRINTEHPLLRQTSMQNAQTSMQDDQTSMQNAQTFQATENTQENNQRITNYAKEPEWKEYCDLLGFWNKKRGENRKPNEGDYRNFLHWLKSYTLLEMKFAVAMIPFHNFWSDKDISPTIFFRQKNKDQTTCDRIGDFLNIHDPGNVTLATMKTEYVVLRDWFANGMPLDEESFKSVMIKLQVYGYDELYAECVAKIKESHATN